MLEKKASNLLSRRMDWQIELMQAALQEARRGMEAGEVPIGAVIALIEENGPEIVARGYNRVNGQQRKTAHAEIVAFERAGGEGRRPPSLPLDAKNAVLVSTLEPCVMCLGAAMEAGMAAVLYGLCAPSDGGTARVKPPDSPESRTPELLGGVRAEASRSLFLEWQERHRSEASKEQWEFVRQLLEQTR